MLLSGASLLAGACSKKESRLEMNFSDKFEGKTVELVSFEDSTILKSGIVSDGRLIFDNTDLLGAGPKLAQVMIDGRVRAFLVVEEGTAQLADTMSVAQGTPLNDRFLSLIGEMDSVENLNDMIKYTEFAEVKYNANKDNPLGTYFGVEWMKYAEPQRVDSMLREAPESFRSIPRVEKYAAFARLRAKTAPGQPFVDFSATQPDGSVQTLASFVRPGRYTLVDFWASWCPYCIKELPELKELYSRYKEKGLDIVGVAVRDKVEDTEASVAKHGIDWDVLYNAQRIPYDIYGFSGIPHLMLIGPDGKIVARGESAAQTATRLEAIFD